MLCDPIYDRRRARRRRSQHTWIKLALRIVYVPKRPISRHAAAIRPGPPARIGATATKRNGNGAGGPITPILPELPLIVRQAGRRGPGREQVGQCEHPTPAGHAFAVKAAVAYCRAGPDQTTSCQRGPANRDRFAQPGQLQVIEQCAWRERQGECIERADRGGTRQSKQRNKAVRPTCCAPAWRRLTEPARNTGGAHRRYCRRRLAHRPASVRPARA